MPIWLLTAIYFVLVIAGFYFTAVKSRVKSFGVYLILALIGSWVILTLSCDEILWIGKILLCR